MSMKAVVWALHQPNLTPAQKIVLLMLSDRHNPDLGCFPSVGRMASDCNMSRSSVFTHLAALEAAGLIVRVGRCRGDGKQTSNQYELQFGSGVQNLDGVGPKAGRGSVQNLDTKNHVINNHVNESILFDDAWTAYPRKIGKGNAKKAWLSAIKKTDEASLCAALNAYIESIAGNDSKYIPHLSTWLNGERWGDDIEIKSPQGADQGFRDMVNDLARVSR
jgi:DNA-binding transcriptional ArsR family regulator